MPELFTWKPDWVGPLKESASDQRSWETLGRWNAQTEQGYAESIRLRQSARFTLDRSEASALLAFWRARRGSYESFEAASLWTPGTGATAAPHNFDDISTVGLVRFASDTAKVQWLSGNLVQITLGFVQDIGGSAENAYVYLFHIWTEDGDSWHGGGSRAPERLTEWGTTLNGYDGFDYTPARIQLDEITEDLEPQKEVCKVTLDMRDSPIIKALVSRELDTPVWMDIYEVDLISDLTYEYFSGRIGPVQREGNVVTVSVQMWGGIMSKQLPAVLKSRTCPYACFSRGCNRLARTARADWVTTGTYKATWSDGKVILDNLVLNAHHQSYIASFPFSTEYPSWGYWSGGYAETGSGSTRQVRPITFSAYHLAADGAYIHIIPLRPFRYGDDWLKVGDVISIVPGCDGNYSTCRDKFHNDVAFGGLPFVPAYIEEAAANSSSAGGK